MLIDKAPDPDGNVDLYHRFELQERYPPEYLWDGPGLVEEYEQFGAKRGRRAVGVVIPAGRILLTSGPAANTPPIADALATLSYTRSGSGQARGAFVDAEQDVIMERHRSGPAASLEFGRAPAVSSGLLIGPLGTASGAALRVGGSVSAPQKIRDVPPVLPEAARQAGIRGAVIVEITIDTEGKVRSARVLRSFPLLDAAALEAVRQWEFTPTVLNGEPREVVMSVTVPFD